MKLNRIGTILLVAAMFLACVRNKNVGSEQSQNQSALQMIKVAEVIQGGSYTYINAKDNGSEKWIAVSKQTVNPGEVLYYSDALPMENFHSKEIDRTFDLIYFVNKISKSPQGTGSATMADPHSGSAAHHSGKVKTEKKTDITVEKSGDELKIEQIFSAKESFEGKIIEISGVVVKVNNQVMGKNWVHIQDGTSANGKYDLTITTQDEVNVGDKVTFKGKLYLNKDFGAGYFYDVIVEEASLTEKQVASL